MTVDQDFMKRYINKKVELKLYHSSNPIYCIVVGIDDFYIHISKGIMKPTNGRGLVQQLYDAINEIDKFEAIDAIGYREESFGHSSVRSIYPILSQAERDAKANELISFKLADSKKTIDDRVRDVASSFAPRAISNHVSEEHSK